MGYKHPSVCGVLAEIKVSAESRYLHAGAKVGAVMGCEYVVAGIVGQPERDAARLAGLLKAPPPFGAVLAEGITLDNLVVVVSEPQRNAARKLVGHTVSPCKAAANAVHIYLAFNGGVGITLLPVIEVVKAGGEKALLVQIRIRIVKLVARIILAEDNQR